MSDTTSPEQPLQESYNAEKRRETPLDDIEEQDNALEASVISSMPIKITNTANQQTYQDEESQESLSAEE